MTGWAPMQKKPELTLHSAKNSCSGVAGKFPLTIPA
jgi:hypothetical protein